MSNCDVLLTSFFFSFFSSIAYSQVQYEEDDDDDVQSDEGDGSTSPKPFDRYDRCHRIFWGTHMCGAHSQEDVYRWTLVANNTR